MTMIRRGNLIWEGLSTDVKPAAKDGAGDGHFLKELDTGDTYERQAGVWINVSTGLSFIRSTKSGITTTNASGISNIVFVTPLISGLYTVALSCQDDANKPVIATFSNMSTTGFRITTRDARSGLVVANHVVSWLATRDYNP